MEPKQKGRPRLTDQQKVDKRNQNRKKILEIANKYLKYYSNPSITGSVYSGLTEKSSSFSKIDIIIALEYAWIFAKYFSFEEHGLSILTMQFKKKTAAFTISDRRMLPAFIKRLIQITNNFLSKGVLHE